MIDVVKYLVEHGADVHAKDDYALRWSARNDHLEVVKCLVEHGVGAEPLHDIRELDTTGIIQAWESTKHQ